MEKLSNNAKLTAWKPILKYEKETAFNTDMDSIKNI